MTTAKFKFVDDLTNLPISDTAREMLRAMEEKYGEQLEGMDEDLRTFLRILLPGTGREDLEIELWLDAEGEIVLVSDCVLMTHDRCADLTEAMLELMLFSEEVKPVIQQFRLEQSRASMA